MRGTNMEEVSDGKVHVRKTAQKLLVAAWIIEIIAAFIGLFFAISRLIPSLDGTALGSITGFQGALPFLAVAIIELTKIPLAYACYEVNNNKWKFVFGFALLAVTFVTFETFFMSFESYQSQLTKQLRPTLDRITTLEREINSAENAKISASEFIDGQDEASERHQENISLINKQFNESTLPLKDQIQAIKNKISQNTVGLDDKLQRLKNDLKKLDADFDTQRDTIDDEFNSSFESAANSAVKQEETDRLELKKYQSDLENLYNQALIDKGQIKSDYQSDLKEANFFEKPRITNDHKNEIKAYEKQYEERKDNLQRNIERLNDILAKTTDIRGDAVLERDKKLQRLEDKYNKKHKEITNSIDEISEVIAVSRTDALSVSDKSLIEDLGENIRTESVKRDTLIATEISSFQEQNSKFISQNQIITLSSQAIATAEKELGVECSSLNDQVNDNPVYRLAKQVIGLKDVCDLSERQLSIIKAVWFGSLALIVAVLGPILAFASFVVRENKPRVIIKEVPVEKIVEVETIKEVPVEKIVEVEVIKEITIDRQVPVEVIKEVPVDKVVFKEVPVEVIRKEVVHIPVYTDDKTLLGKVLSEKDKK